MLLSSLCHQLSNHGISFSNDFLGIFNVFLAFKWQTFFLLILDCRDVYDNVLNVKQQTQHW